MKGSAIVFVFLKMPEVIGTRAPFTVESKSLLSLEVKIQINASKR
jgi:hypothetical protein